MAIVEAAPRDWSAERSTLVHGDLYARHLLIDGDGRPSGVIDWGDVHLGDPAIDLAFAAGFLPPGAQEEFRRSYGRVGDDTWKIARLKALHTAVTIVVAGDDTGDRDLVREGKIALRHLSAAISD